MYCAGDYLHHIFGNFQTNVVERHKVQNEHSPEADERLQLPGETDIVKMSGENP
jgi:hypothetical protein